MSEKDMGVDTSTRQTTMSPVQSSHLVAVGFDSDTGTLRVEFRGGAIYEWTVDEEDYQALMDSPSPGRYLRYNIEQTYGAGVRVG